MKKILILVLIIFSLFSHIMAIENITYKKKETTNPVNISLAKEKAKKAVSAESVTKATLKTEGKKTKYIITTERKAKFLGFFEMVLKSEVKINTDTGSISEVNEPWYSFLVF